MDTNHEEHLAYEGEEGNPVYGLERRGVDYVPERERHMNLRNLAVFWIGTNLYPFNIVLGVLAYTLGLSVWLTLLTLAAGILLSYWLVGLTSIPPARAGIPTMAVSRAAFGLRFARINAALAWLVGILFEIINASIGVFAVLALFAFLGWDDSGTAGKLIGLAFVYALSVLLAFLGHGTVVHVQRFFSIALGVISIVVLIEALPDLDLGASLGGDYDLWGTLSAMAIILGIVIAGHVAYVIAAADYPRYLPSDTPAKDIVRTVMWAAGGSGLLLGVVGILLASQTDADLVVDTFGGVKSLMPSWVYLPFLLAAIGGSLTNLMLTMYSAGLAAQAAGLPIKRYYAVIVDAVLATIGLVYVLFYDEALLTTINDIVVNTIIWVGPWGVIWIYDAWRRNWNIDPVAAHGGPESPYWGSGGVYWPGAIALIAGMVAAWATISVPRYAGPISEHLLNFTDLSWLAGPLVALAVFIPLDRAQRPTVG